jgi:hypothetical protein
MRHRDAVSHEKEQQRTHTQVGDILEHDIDGVVEWRRSRLKRRKSGLHEEYQYRAKEQHQIIDRVGYCSILSMREFCDQRQGSNCNQTP